MATVMETPLESPPIPGSQAGLDALRAMLGRTGWRPTIDPLAALEAFRGAAGDIYQVNLPGFHPIILAGPEAGRLLYVTQRDSFSWRNEDDAVVNLLRRGVLIVDGQEHDRLRQLMDPALHRQKLHDYAPVMVRYTDQVTDAWQDGEQRDMLVEMRRIALLNLADTLFGVDLTPDLERIWQPILRAIRYISPGLWLLWPGAPRLGYAGPLAALDDWLHQVIRRRRAGGLDGAEDMLSGLLAQPGLDDETIRDQMLTMLIAGHDTATALMAWTLYLLGCHPQALARVRAEIDAGLAGGEITAGNVQKLEYLDQVIGESLRLYPPIHASIRRAMEDVSFQGYRIPAGARVMFSIYLTNRHPDYWERPDEFLPERFGGGRPKAYTYVPFGGGPRNCIGAMYGKVEAKIVLARLLSRFDLAFTGHHVHPHMGATLEPRPGVRMRVQRRPGSSD